MFWEKKKKKSELMGGLLYRYVHVTDQGSGARPVQQLVMIHTQ